MALNLLAKSRRDLVASRRPLIAVTPDYTEGRFQTENLYSIRMLYCSALQTAGALPIIVPYGDQTIPDLVEIFDGFVISGSSPGTLESPLRTQFELNLIKLAAGERKAILGICNGMQMMALAFGGVVRNIDQCHGDRSVDHLPADVPDRAAHEIRFTSVNRLSDLAHGPTALVNSLHRQAIAEVGDFEVLAEAHDGTIEAISLNTQSYAIGVQWHPEYRLSKFDSFILEDFVRAAKRLGSR